MSTIGILSPSTRFPTTGPESGPGDFLDLSLSFPDEDPLGLIPLPSNSNTCLWNGELTRSPPAVEAEAESNWVDQRPINAQDCNGQFTLPPSSLEEKDFNNLISTTPTLNATQPKAKPRKTQDGKTQREKSLERNRVAASKCRQKKKEHTAHLESRFKAQWQKKAQLESELSNLRCQIVSIKNEVLKHAHCGDGYVGEHLSRMMQLLMRHHATLEPENKEHAEGVPPPPHLLPQLQLDFDLGEAVPALLEQEMRRGSKASLSSEASFALSMEESFDDLINV